MKGICKYMKLFKIMLGVMLNFLMSLGIGLIMGSCSSNTTQRNPFLLELSFQQQIDLNLPQYNNLLYAGGTVILQQFGHKGILVFNLNGSNYLAWDASCPNHLPNNCSQTAIEGVLSVCSCEQYQYSLANGQLLNPPEDATQVYPLLNYQVVVRGTSLVISN